jgi:hypothetical protein
MYRIVIRSSGNFSGAKGPRLGVNSGETLICRLTDASGTTMPALPPIIVLNLRYILLRKFRELQEQTGIILNGFEDRAIFS